MHVAYHAFVHKLVTVCYSKINSVVYTKLSNSGIVGEKKLCDFPHLSFE